MQSAIHEGYEYQDYFTVSIILQLMLRQTDAEIIIDRNDIIFIMKKWSSSYKGDNDYPGNAIPLYSGSKLYIKKEYIGMLEQRFGTLMMKTYVQSYKQTY